MDKDKVNVNDSDNNDIAGFSDLALQDDTTIIKNEDRSRSKQKHVEVTGTRSEASQNESHKSLDPTNVYSRKLPRQERTSISRNDEKSRSKSQDDRDIAQSEDSIFDGEDVEIEENELHPRKLQRRDSTSLNGGAISKLISHDDTDFIKTKETEANRLNNNNASWKSLNSADVYSGGFQRKESISCNSDDKKTSLESDDDGEFVLALDFISNEGIAEVEADRWKGVPEKILDPTNIYSRKKSIIKSLSNGNIKSGDDTPTDEVNKMGQNPSKISVSQNVLHLTNTCSETISRQDSGNEKIAFNEEYTGEAIREKSQKQERDAKDGSNKKVHLPPSVVEIFISKVEVGSVLEKIDSCEEAINLNKVSSNDVEEGEEALDVLTMIVREDTNSLNKGGEKHDEK